MNPPPRSLAVNEAATAEPHPASEGALSSGPPAADRLSNTPTERQSADSPQHPVRNTDSGQSGEEARRRDAVRVSKKGIEQRMPAAVRRELENEIRSASEVTGAWLNKLDEQFELCQKYGVTRRGLRGLVFRVRVRHGKEVKSLRDRQESLKKILDQTFGPEGKKNPHLWEKRAYLMLVGLLYERLATNEKEVSTEELVALSKMLAEQRRAEAQSRGGREPQTGSVAGGTGSELPSDFGEVVKQIYGTNFHTPA